MTETIIEKDGQSYYHIDDPDITIPEATAQFRKIFGRNYTRLHIDGKSTMRLGPLDETDLAKWQAYRAGG